MSFLTKVRSHVLARENEPVVITLLPTWSPMPGKYDGPARYEEIEPRDDPFAGHPMHCKCYHHR
jgi:hypothetical protein